jgi:hypothetical protein
MNLLDSRVVLRLRGVPELLDLAFRVTLQANGRVYLRLSAVTLLPCFAACLGLRYLAHWRWLSVWLAAAAMVAAAQGVFTVAAGRLLFAESLPVGEVLGRFFRRLPSYLATLVLLRLVIIGCALLVASGASPATIALITLAALSYPFLWARSVFLHEIVLLEGSSPGQTMARGRRFIVRQYGAALGLLVSLLGAQVAFVVVFELLGQAAVGWLLQLGEPLGNLWENGGSVYALAGFFVAVPYLATARFLKYIDVRTAKEGWDIQLKFTALQTEPGGGRKIAA